MALPTKTQTLNNFTSSTFEYRKKDLVDNYFGSAPLYVYMRRKNNISIRGGTEIRVAHVYQNIPGSSYTRGTAFDTSVYETNTQMIFNWKFTYVPANLHVIDVELNDSPQQTFDMVDALLANAEASLIDELSTQLQGDGTGNVNLDIDGLAIAVSRTGTYGGITRAATQPGASIRCATEDTTGGVLSLASANTVYQSCVIGRSKPDLMVTTQTIWNRFWERSQPSERNTAGGERGIGFDSVRFNQADVIVDSHVPTGFLYFLTTEWWEYYLRTGRDFFFRGFMEPSNQELLVGQVGSWGNVCCRSPRQQAVMSGLT